MFDLATFYERGSHRNRRLIEYVRPLVTDEELKETRREVKSFFEEDGKDLNKKLLKLQEEVPTSWIEGFWDSAYFEYRSCAPININPAFLLNDDPQIDGTQPNCHIVRASKLLAATAIFIHNIRAGKLECDPPGSQQCLFQFVNMFGGAKIPSPNRDYLIVNRHSRHIIVLIRNQYYVLDILGESGTPYSWKQFEKVLHTIWEDALQSNTYDHPNICVLTTEHRDVWARAYTRLHEINSETLDWINSAQIVLILDENSPKDLNEAGISVLHNFGKNRWFDKSVQLIVHRNSVTGINMEHSGFDGQALIRYCKELFELSRDMKDLDTGAFKQPPKHFKLQWEVNDRILTAMNRSERLFEEFSSSMDSCVMHFKKIGKNLIKDKGISPDAIMQLGFHMAYFMTFNQLGSTYESCAMTHFYHGRTECLRSLTSEVKEAIHVLFEIPSSPEDQLKAIKKAFDAHKKRAMECQEGLGIDRHLYALYQLAKQKIHCYPHYKMPKLFHLASWNRLRKDSMSTSNCGNQTLQLFMFGPVINDGLGIGYIMKDEEILVSVTSFQQKSKQYVANLELATKFLRGLILKNKPVRRTPSKL